MKIVLVSAALFSLMPAVMAADGTGTAHSEVIFKSDALSGDEKLPL